MPKYQVTFTRTITYEIELSAKNEDLIEDKLNEKIEKLSEKQISELEIEISDFKIDEYNEL